MWSEPKKEVEVRPCDEKLAEGRMDFTRRGGVTKQIVGVDPKPDVLWSTVKWEYISNETRDASQTKYKWLTFLWSTQLQLLQVSIVLSNIRIIP